jgi:hypothetical protein
MTIYLVQAGEELVVFQMEEQMGDVLLSTGGVKEYALLSADSDSQIIVELISGGQNTYTWNSQSQSFKPPPRISPEYEQAMAIQEINHALFDLEDAQTTITLLEALLSSEIIEHGPDYGIPLVKPRLLYLLGLAHELTNNEIDAIQTYWELWQAYPDSPYTQLAKSKLDRVTP